MPELPEVETVRRGLAPHLLGQKIHNVLVRQYSLRWPIPDDFCEVLEGQTFKDIDRRGKYLLMHLTHGTLIAHLGMSGSFRLCAPNIPFKKHDHVIITLDNQTLRYHDPRRFGSLHWTTDQPLTHALLAKLGPEPLCDSFTAQYLFEMLNRRKKAVKSCLMDHHLVVGVGNIYAAEALFKAGVRPDRSACTVTLEEAKKLHTHIRYLLKKAIDQGGTTLRDFVNADDQPGYFQQTLAVYGRAREPCRVCNTRLESMIIGQRSSVFCPKCQQ